MLKQVDKNNLKIKPLDCNLEPEIYHPNDIVNGYYDDFFIVGMYCVRRLYKDDEFVSDMIKSIDEKFNKKNDLINSINNNRTVYIPKFKIIKNMQNKGFGYSMQIESLKKENLPKNTEYVLLYVKPDNIIALNMHIKAGGRICGYWDGSDGFTKDYLIYYKII